MAKRKKIKAVVTTKPDSKPGNPVLTSTALIVATAWLCLLLACAYLVFLQLPADNRQKTDAVSEQLLKRQTQSLQTAISLIQTQLSSYAKTPQLASLLGEQDMEALAAMGSQLSFFFPDSISVRLIPLGPLGIAGLGKNNITLRNNIEVDMIRRASKLETVPVELYYFDDEWLLSLAQPVINNAASAEPLAVGAILLTLNSRFVDTILAQLDPQLGQTSLLLGGNKTRPVTRQGKAGNSSYLQESKPYPNWQLTFAPSQQLIDGHTNSPNTVYLLLGSSALLISLAALLGYRLINQSLTFNLEQLLAFAQLLVNKSKAAKPDLTLPRFDELADKMSQLRRLEAPESIQKKSDAAPAKNLQEQLADPLFHDSELLDLDEIGDLNDVLDLHDTLDLSENEAPRLNEQIFRAYDIRGIAERDLGENVCYHIGLAIGSEAAARGQQGVIVASDGRHSSPAIKEALKKGLMDSGRDVIDIGMVPTPLLYFATHHLDTRSGVMITGSHNPAEYNGLKIVIDGMTLTYDAIQDLKIRVQTQNYQRGEGSMREEDVVESYIDTIISDVAIAQPLKVVIDCGNGIAGALAPRLIEELGCEVIPLYCEVDGNFPNHHPDPSIIENLTDLIAAVAEHKADLGIALDGDGDRIGVISASGKVILPDRLLMLFAQDIVSRNPGTDVIFDVKSTRHLNTLISGYGGRPIMWKSGHSYIKEKMHETGALLGGELSGHIFFKERWYGFDDGIYSAARLIEILSTSDADLDNQLSMFPESIGTSELHINVSEEHKFHLMDTLVAQAKFDDAKITYLDGIRADFPDGWGLVRASNTTPVLTLRFEAETAEALARIQELFKNQLSAADNTLSFPF
jgi:phosphomannomutase/phosphoglucomutase